MMNNYSRNNSQARNSCPLCEQNRCAARRYDNSYCNRNDNRVERRDLPNHSNGGGCGCSNDCDKLMHDLQKLDFVIYELVLYLDAYPECTEALEMYNRLVCQRAEVVAEYERKCGPISILGNKSTNSWDWVKGYLPWEYGAN